MELGHGAVVASRLKEVIVGQAVRSTCLEQGLESRMWVDCLLEMAMDDNLLARTWIGWAPWC